MTGAPDGEPGDRRDGHAAELEAAGLVDPADPDAPARRELFGWLLDHDVPAQAIAAALASPGQLSALAGDVVGRRGVTISLTDVAARTGLDLGRLDEIRRAMGLAPLAPAEPLFTEAELAVFDLLAAAADMFSWDELVQFVRVVGSSVAAITDAANSLFLSDVERPMRDAGASDVDVARRSARAVDLAADLRDLLGMLVRLHMVRSTAWSRAVQARAGADAAVAPVAIGFVDLVGFTPRSAGTDAAGLAALVNRFESTAHAVVTDGGGRLVKLIGDEVMFAAVEPARGCDIAVGLLRAFGTDDALTPRGGLAYGDVLARSGDFFGPTVNLAARLADLAVPGEVLTTPATVQAAGRVATPAGRRLPKGFDGPVEVVALEP